MLKDSTYWYGVASGVVIVYVYHAYRMRKATTSS